MSAVSDQSHYHRVHNMTLKSVWDNVYQRIINLLLRKHIIVFSYNVVGIVLHERCIILQTFSSLLTQNSTLFLHCVYAATKLPLLRATLSSHLRPRCSSKLNARLARLVLCWLVLGVTMDGKFMFVYRWAVTVFGKFVCCHHISVHITCTSIECIWCAHFCSPPMIHIISSYVPSAVPALLVQLPTSLA